MFKVCRSMKQTGDMSVVSMIDTIEIKVEKSEFNLGDLVILSKFRLQLFPCTTKSEWSGLFKVVRVVLQKKIELEIQCGKKKIVNCQWVR